MLKRELNWAVQGETFIPLIHINTYSVPGAGLGAKDTKMRESNITLLRDSYVVFLNWNPRIFGDWKFQKNSFFFFLAFVLIINFNSHLTCYKGKTFKLY